MDRNKEIKKLGLLFYTAGRFEGLKADAGSTIEFVESDNPILMPSRNDIAIIRDMKSAWYAMDKHDKISVSTYMKAHGNMVASTNVPNPGHLRERPVQVSFGSGLRMWLAEYPSVNEELFSQKISEAISGDDNYKQKAARLFGNIAKLQPFPDGNKRTALLVANRLLIPDNEVMLIPYDDSDYQLFMLQLESFYRNEMTLDEFGAAFSRNIVDVDNLEITKPFGRIVNLTAQTRTYRELNTNPEFRR
ncbi:Fic family protein [Weissella confusa]|uniref:Fic family protein n=1 Tax=Weissella confusa TaxID=1583 RepID=UPI001C6FC1CB|nr:Fic family protein [Weissella confusa]QYU56856.1 Fic family protein [Weissella confusa]